MQKLLDAHNILAYTFPLSSNILDYDYESWLWLFLLLALKNHHYKNQLLLFPSVAYIMLVLLLWEPTMAVFSIPLL